MKDSRKVAVAIFCLLVSMQTLSPAAGEETRMMILKVRYIAVEGTDVEYGQGAIERNELEHAVLGSDAWLIRVAASGDPRSWNERLDASVDPAHGRFEVGHPTEEELRRVESGELAFQQ